MAVAIGVDIAANEPLEVCMVKDRSSLQPLPYLFTLVQGDAGLLPDFGADFVEPPADVDLPADVVKPDSPFLVAKEKLRFIGSEDSELCS